MFTCTKSSQTLQLTSLQMDVCVSKFMTIYTNHINKLTGYVKADSYVLSQNSVFALVNA